MNDKPKPAAVPSETSLDILPLSPRHNLQGQIALLCAIVYWLFSIVAACLNASFACLLALSIGVAGFALGVRAIASLPGKIAVALTVAPFAATLSLFIICIGHCLNRHG